MIIQLSLVQVLSHLGSAIQVAWSPNSMEVSEAVQDDHSMKPSSLTLRNFLKDNEVHVALAPIRCSTILHLAILQSLKNHDLAAGIKSFSGTSTGAIAAAVWASRDAGSSPITLAFGQNISRRDCEPDCKPLLFYLNYLDSPIDSEREGLRAVLDKEKLSKYVRNFNNGFLRVPSVEESVASWLQTSFYLDLLQVKKNFDDVHIPVVASGFQGSVRTHDRKSKSVLMYKGNLHLALLATASPPGNTLPIGINEDDRVTDGWFGDYFGARGYAALPNKPPNMFAISFFDADIFSLNASALQGREHLRAVASLQLYFEKPLLIFHALDLAKRGLPHYTWKDAVFAVHDCMSSVIDQPMDAKIDKALISYSLVAAVDFSLPKLQTTMEATVKHISFELIHFFRSKFAPDEASSTDPDIVVQREVIDKDKILENPQLHRAKERHFVALQEMYGGAHYSTFDSTPSSNLLPEFRVPDIDDLQKLSQRKNASKIM